MAHAKVFNLERKITALETLKQTDEQRLQEAIEKLESEKQALNDNLEEMKAENQGLKNQLDMSKRRYEENHKKQNCYNR